jgi:spore coat polysaccharide biosynthesis protein SpsF (cytidylyltransferase family)
MEAPVPGLILVRSLSTRLPKKCFLPFGEGCVLEHVGNRAVHFGFDPIVCTTQESADDGIAQLALKKKWRMFRGSTNDKIRRLRDACDYYNLTQFVTIDADDPFFDPEADQKIFAELQNGFDFVTPPSDYYCGSIGYAVKTKVLDRAVNEYNTDNSEMMWKILERVQGVRIKRFPSPNEQMTKIRLTLDYEEDYHILLAVLRILGRYATADDIEQLFKNNPDFYKINWFRQDLWKENQDITGNDVKLRP